MTEPVEPAAAPGMSRGVRWLLIASLGLNLLVAGVVVGNMVAGPMGGRPPAVELALGPFARALEPQDRRAIARDLFDRADLRGMGRNERRADLAELAAALRAEPFDRDAVSAIMVRQRDKVRGLETAVEGAVLDRLAAMTAEERAGFAERLEAEIGHRGPRGD
jgi:uncharacterized membrane protein